MSAEERPADLGRVFCNAGIGERTANRSNESGINLPKNTASNRENATAPKRAHLIRNVFSRSFVLI